MAFITPKTDWLETDRCTYVDMNRIAGNTNELCGTSFKADYTNNDVVTLSEWQAIASALTSKADEVGYTIVYAIGNAVTAANFNAAESATFGIKARIDLIERQEAARLYAGDNVYLGDGYYLR